MSSQDDDRDDFERFPIKRHESVQGCHVRGALLLERQLVEEHREEGRAVPQIRITLPSLRRIRACAACGCDVCRVFAAHVPEPPASGLCLLSRLVHLERRVSFVRHVDAAGGNRIVLRRAGRVVGQFAMPELLDKYKIARDE